MRPGKDTSVLDALLADPDEEDEEMNMAAAEAEGAEPGFDDEEPAEEDDESPIAKLEAMQRELDQLKQMLA
jgi:hypothetical protein